jgi:hypothetical protein
VRLAFVQAALTPERMRFRPALHLNRDSLLKFLAQRGRRPLDPRDETIRFVGRAIHIMQEGKSVRERFDATIDRHARAVDMRIVMEGFSEPIGDVDGPEPIGDIDDSYTAATPKAQGARPADYARGWYAGVAKQLNDFADWLEELHADINELANPRTPPEHYLMAFALSYDRNVLILFESLLWVYHRDALSHESSRDWLILPSRWLHDETMLEDGTRMWVPPDVLDEKLLLDAERRAQRSSAQFLLELERTPRGRSLIQRWRRWTSSCVCDGAKPPLRADCIFVELSHHTQGFLGRAELHALEEHRSWFPDLGLLRQFDHIVEIPILMRALLATDLARTRLLDHGP